MTPEERLAALEIAARLRPGAEATARGALLLAGLLADYGIPGCDWLPVAATMDVVKLSVNGLEVEVDDRHARMPLPGVRAATAAAGALIAPVLLESKPAEAVEVGRQAFELEKA